MFMFGLVTTLQGLVQNYSGILTTRLFLGLFEAGKFFPLACPRCYSEDVCVLIFVGRHVPGMFLLDRYVVQA